MEYILPREQRTVWSPSHGRKFSCHPLAPQDKFRALELSPPPPGFSREENSIGLRIWMSASRRCLAASMRANALPRISRRGLDALWLISHDLDGPAAPPFLEFNRSVQKMYQLRNPEPNFRGGGGGGFAFQVRKLV